MPEIDCNLDYEVVVFGLGFVGLTLAVAFADAGVGVLGVETNKDTVKSLQDGVPHFYEKGLQESLICGIDSGKIQINFELPSSDRKRAYIIAVGTPLEGNQLSTSSIQNVLPSICSSLKPGDLVILRSTVSIGMTQFIRDQIKSKVDFDFFIAMCPERTIEGLALLELKTLPQIVGAPDIKSRQVAAKLFEKISPNILEVHSFESAEMTKLANNIARDVKFALANEIAFACESLGIDFQEVRHATTVGYPREGLAQAGPVGGPCLEKDSWILLESLQRNGQITQSPFSVIKNARLINESIPDYVIERLGKIHGGDSQKLSILHLGIAFKGYPPTDDMRGADSLKVIKALKNSGAQQFAIDFEILNQDLIFLNIETDTSLFFRSTFAIIVIYNNHIKNRSFVLQNLESFSESSQVFILDLWNLFDSNFVWPSNFNYQSLGNNSYE